MNGRRVFHARGKVLGGSSQHQRDDLPARQPAGLRALGRRARAWRSGTTPTACPTSSGWRPASPAPTTGAAATVRSCSSAARPTNPLFGAFFEAAQQAGYPLTDDVNGYRQEGFARFDRNVHRGRRLSAARAYLHPVPRPARTSRVETLALATGCGSRASAPSASTTCAAAGCDRTRRRRRGHPLRRRDQHPAAAPALRRRRRGDCSRQHGIDVVHHLPGVGENLQDHLEVYIQYASKQPVSIAPGLRWRAPARASPTSGCSTAAGSAPPTTSRAAASPAATTTSTTRT